ncbi:MAG TPA: histidine kinase dimerization/phospho-acceptor domain-containing protein, partial [Planctomycetota bacterium]|nr:histidine kinase dimerization/phospho-acceptor domain-containing protein [Planctomycetota bacterium]
MEDKTPDCLSLTELVAGLVHEIRNPLSTINLNLQLLKEDWRESESPRDKRTVKKLDVIQAETQRLEEILNDILHFVRIESLELQPQDVNAMLDEITEFKA